jgi:hypothetical protein
MDQRDRAADFDRFIEDALGGHGASFRGRGL